MSHDPHLAHHRPLESLFRRQRMSWKLSQTRLMQAVGQTWSLTWSVFCFVFFAACIWGKNTKRQSHEVKDEYIERCFETTVRWRRTCFFIKQTQLQHWQSTLFLLPWVGVLSRQRTPVLRHLSYSVPGGTSPSSREKNWPLSWSR